MNEQQPTTSDLLALIRQQQQRIDELEAGARARRGPRRFWPSGRVASLALTAALAASIAAVPSFAGAANQGNPFWGLAGNGGTNPANNYLGTSDSAGLSIRTAGKEAISIDANQNVTVRHGFTAKSGVTFGDGSTQSTAGLSSVAASGPLSSSGGTAPIISLSGVVPIANGGTGSAIQNFVDLSSNQSIAGTKTFSSTIQGDISGNAGTVTHGLYSTESYANPTWLTSLGADKIVSPSTGALADPSWLGSVAASKITGTLSTANIPDLSSSYVTTDGQQTISGAKTFSAPLTASSGLTSNGTVNSTSGGFKFPDGSIQTTAQYPTYGGLVDSTGAIVYASKGVTVTHTGTGAYTITLPAGTVQGGLNLIPMINVVSGDPTAIGGYNLYHLADGSEVYNVQLDQNGSPADEVFFFTFTRM